jgi:hypothetical protein
VSEWDDWNKGDGPFPGYGKSKTPYIDAHAWDAPAAPSAAAPSKPAATHEHAWNDNKAMRVSVAGTHEAAGPSILEQASKAWEGWWGEHATKVADVAAHAPDEVPASAQQAAGAAGDLVGKFAQSMVQAKQAYVAQQKNEQLKAWAKIGLGFALIGGVTVIAVKALSRSR